MELRLLGAVDLRREGVEVDTILAQPRRLALLAYLALARPGGFLRRDRLLGVFWPDADEKRARAALRQAIRFLRRGLGAGAVVSRGDGEIGLAEATVGCDAVAFDRAIEAGDDERALSLYRGHLLPGFIVSNAAAFDLWLEGERLRLRTAAVDAAGRQVDAAEKEGDLELARERARRAVDLDPVGEAPARRLIELLARTGDRAAAVATYDRLAERLRSELDLAPAPRTTALVEAVRSRADALPTDAVASTAPGPARGRILVRALENRTGDPGLDVLGTMAADWVARALTVLPDAEVVPPMVALAASRRDGDPAAAADGAPGPDALARASGAGTVIGGAIDREGDDLRFSARISDLTRGVLLRGPEPVTAALSGPLRGIELLADRVVACIAPALDARAVHVLGGDRPPSFDAYRRYMEGLELFIRGRWAPALDRFRAASDIEPGYALPRIVSAIALWNLGDLPGARSVAVESARLRDTVGPFERAILDTVQAWLDGDWAAAQEACRRQAALAPGSIPHFQVAEEARRLNRPREARDVLLGLDPEAGELDGWIFYWIELATAYHMLGDHEAELDAARRARAIHATRPEAALLEIRALAALGREAELDGVLEAALSAPGDRPPSPGALLREAGLELRAHGSAGAGDALLERSLEWHRAAAGERGADVEARRALARVLYDTGRWEEAEARFRELIDGPGAGVVSVSHHHGHLQGHLDEGYLAALAMRRGDPDAAADRRRRLETLDRPFLYGSQWLWTAAVAALEDDPDRAARSLRRAFAEGLPFGLFLHTDPHIRRLRGHPVVDALLRPRG